MQTENIKSTRYFNYTDAEGNLIYQIQRLDFFDGGKTFKQRRPDGRGGWHWNLGDTPQVPYRLPEVKHVIQKGGLVFIVEGEKCADALNFALRAERLNAVATCNNGGARHWGATQSQHLTGANVVLLPDPDEPGRDHVVIAARHLISIVKTIKRIDLEYDIADWLALDHTIDELRQLYHAAQPYQPPAEQPITKRYELKPTPVDNPSRYVTWAQRVLEGNVEALARLTDGRFHQLKAAANLLGTIAARGWLTETECVTGLMSALETNGYISKPGKGYRTAENEVKHYFKSGLSFPCDPPADAEPTRTRAKPEPREAEAEQESDTWNRGVPIMVRGLLNAHTHPSIGPIIELIYEGINRGLITDTNCLTAKELKKVSDTLARGLSENAIRKGLQQAANPHGVYFLRVIPHYMYSSEEELESGTTDQPTRTRAKPGRTADVYALRSIPEVMSGLADFAFAPLIQKFFPLDAPLLGPMHAEFLADLDREDAESVADELMQRYGAQLEAQPGYAEAMKALRRKYRRLLYKLDHPQYAPIAAGRTYKNTTEYTACCARAILEAQPGGEGQISRLEWCEMLGCTERMLPTVFRRAAIVVHKKRYVERVITSVKELQAIGSDYDKRYAGAPTAVASSRCKDAFPFNKRGLAVWAAGEFAAGATVTVRYQQANFYTLARLGRWAMDSIRGILDMLGNLFKPREDAEQAELMPEPQPELIPETEEEKKARPEPKPRKPTYAEGVFAKWVDRFAQMKLEIQSLPGNLMRGAVQLGLDALLGNSAVSDDSDSETDVNVLDFCVNVLGGTIGYVIEHIVGETGSVDALPVSESMGYINSGQSYHDGTEARQQLGLDRPRSDPPRHDEPDGVSDPPGAGAYRSATGGCSGDYTGIQRAVA